LQPDHAAGFDERFVPHVHRRCEANGAANRSWSSRSFASQAPAEAAAIPSRAAAGFAQRGSAVCSVRSRPRAQSANAAPRSVACGAHNRPVDTDALSARFRWPTVRRSPSR
jgi:hypothetical protein